MSVNLMSCAKCGPVHERCLGHKKRVVPLTPCMAYPRAGGRVCYVHGENTRHKEASKRRAKEQENLRRVGEFLA